MDDEALAALGGILTVLWHGETARPDKPCSLAWLSKQSQLPMSTLRRQLSTLEQAGLVMVIRDGEGIGGTVTLSAAGRQIAATLDV